MKKKGAAMAGTRRGQATPAARGSATNATMRRREPTSSEEADEEDRSEGEKEDARSSERCSRDESSAEQGVPARRTHVPLEELIKTQKQTARENRVFFLQQSTASKVFTAVMTARQWSDRTKQSHIRLRRTFLRHAERATALRSSSIYISDSLLNTSTSRWCYQSECLCNHA